MISWKKQGTAWRSAAGPFVLRVAPKGDGRFTWEVVADGADSPQASGIGTSLGAAKTAGEQYVLRSGRI